MSQNNKNPKKMKSQIHCPVPGCLYSLGSERHFTEKKLLNQHIAKVHAEKKFSCAKCQKSFGTDWYRRHHEQTCGIEWKCYCGNVYASRLSLLTHARRNQHKLPDHVITSDKMKQNKATSKFVDNPVIVLIQPIIQNVTCIQPAQTSVVTPRRILPKTTQPVLLTLSIPSNIIASTPAQNSISPAMPEQTKENLFSPVKSFNSDGAIISTPNQIFNNSNNNISTSTQKKCQNSVATQTVDDICDNPAKKRQSQASQCSRHKLKTLNVGIESTHTQTAESAVIKIKKRRSRRKSVAITTEPSMLNDSLLFPGNSIWPGFKDFMQQGDNQGTRSFKNSASTQTSIMNNNKILCDSETITDKELLKYPWEDALKVKENESCNTDFQMLTEVGAHSMKVKETESCNTDFQMLTDIGADSMKIKENESCNTDFQMLTDIGADTLSVLPAVMDNNPLSDLNIFSNSLNSFSEMKSSAKENNPCQIDISEKNALHEKSSVFSVFGNCVESNPAPRTLSDIHTQTIASAVLDFNLLANMETQTTDDFNFSDLEFSDTETQTPWEDLPNIDDSPLQTDQLSIEIQTDFPAFPAGLNLDPFELINSVDVQNMISGCSTKGSLGVNTETQTLDQFCFPQFTNSESQTLDIPDFMFDSLDS